MNRKNLLGLAGFQLVLGALSLLVWVASPKRLEPSGWFLLGVAILAGAGGSALLVAGLRRPADPRRDPARTAARPARVRGGVVGAAQVQRPTGAGRTGSQAGPELPDKVTPAGAGDRPSGAELAAALQAALGSARGVISFSDNAGTPDADIEPRTKQDPRIARIQLECPHCGSTTDAYVLESEAERANVTCQHCKQVFEFGPGVMYNPVGYVTALPLGTELAEVTHP